MNPQPSKFKKFLLPLVVIIIIVIGGVFLFKAKATNQGAALYKAVSAKTVTQGSVGSVSTGGNPLPCLSGSTVPKIQVISPNGGETFTAGQQVTVKWNSCNIPASGVITIVPSYENGANHGAYSISGGINDGSELITLPNVSNFGPVFPSGNYFKIGVVYQPYATGPNAVDARDYSDNLFTINGVNSPLLLTPIDNQATYNNNSQSGNGLPNIALFDHLFKLKNTSGSSVWVSCGFVSTTTDANPQGFNGGGAVGCSSSPAGYSNGWMELSPGQEVIMNRSSNFTPDSGSIGMHAAIRSRIDGIQYKTSANGSIIWSSPSDNPLFQASWVLATPYVTL